MTDSLLRVKRAEGCECSVSSKGTGLGDVAPTDMGNWIPCEHGSTVSQIDFEAATADALRLAVKVFADGADSHEDIGKRAAFTVNAMLLDELLHALTVGGEYVTPEHFEAVFDRVLAAYRTGLRFAPEEKP